MSHVKKYIALVYSSCYNKIPQAAWFINNRNLFLTTLEAVKSKVKMLVWSVSAEDPPPGS